MASTPRGNCIRTSPFAASLRPRMTMRARVDAPSRMTRSDGCRSHTPWLRLSRWLPRLSRRCAGRSSVPIVVPARRRAPVVPFAVILLLPLLILRRHHPVRVALAIPDIEVGAMPARHGIAAAALVTCSLVLRRQISVRIAHAIAGAQIPAMAAWRRMDGNTVLHGLRQHRCDSACKYHAHLNGQCCGGNADDHGSSPIKPEAAGVSSNTVFPSIRRHAAMVGI